MPKKYKNIAWHLSAFSLRMLGVLCFLVFGLVVAFMWRVSQSPLDISFAKQYIQSAMHDAETGNYALIDRAVLYWPDLKGPLFLEVEGGQLLNQNDATILSVNMAALSFSRAGLISGRVMPKAIILKSPTLQLMRTEQGSIEFDLGHPHAKESKTKPVDQQDQLELTTRIFGYIARPGVESANNSLISKLQSFAIEDARLVVDDRIAQQSWSLPDFNLKLESTRTGMDGNIHLKLPDVGLEESNIDVNLNYVWDEKNVEVSADIKTFDMQALAQKIPEFGMLANQNVIVDAHIETIFDETFTPADVRIDVTSAAGSLQHPDMSDEPIPYSDLALKATYNYAGKTVKIMDTKVTLKDITVFAEAQVEHTQTKVSGPVKIWVEETRQENIEPLWPKFLREDNARVWIVEKLSDGVFKDVWLKFDVLAQKQSKDDGQTPAWDADIQNLESEFLFEGMSADYRAPLDAANKAYGSGRFDLDKDELTININRGFIGKMAVKDAHLMFREIVAKGKGTADLMIPMKAKVADVMRFISKEPIDLGDQLDMDISKVRGDADIRVELDFPTRKDVAVEDFKIGITGNVNNILLPDIVETLDLSGGPLAFNIKDGLVSMKGKAMLEKRDMDFEWSTFLDGKDKPYDEKIQARITADPNLRQMLGVDLSDFIEGSLPLNISYVRQRNGSAKANVKVDVSPALFFVEPFNFAKKSGDTGSASFDAHFKNGQLQKITDLTAKGAGFNLPKAEITFAQAGAQTMLSKGTLSNFSVDITTGSLDFSFDKARAVTINMKAATFDARPFMEGKEVKAANAVTSENKGDTQGNAANYNEPPMKIFLSAASMQTAPNKNVGETKIYMDIDEQGRFNQMEMDAALKEGQVSVRYKPDENGVRTFRLESNNAGEFLDVFDVYTNIRGGSMTIYGESIKGVNDRNLRGKAEIRKFRVVKAPALTKILSILSLTGIGEALTSNGLDFSKLEADFNWGYRKDGSLLKIKDGRTSGNVLGLLFKGTFDNASRTVDVDGTIVPMSGLNKVIGKIPLVGDILTGGSGGVFAATYSIKGKSDNPTISVNPLSVIAPGIIRRVLFE